MPFLLSKKRTTQAISKKPNTDPITIPTIAPAGSPAVCGRGADVP